jgi:uncharacterized damage-inducible protein DinB
MSTKKILLAQYDLHDVLFNNVIKDISDAESGICIAEPINTVKWLAGHLAWAQLNLGNIGGAPQEFAWRDHFCTIQGGSDQDKNAPKSELPTLAQIRDKWNEMSPAIRKGLGSLPDAALDTVIEAKHPIAPFDNTLGGLWAFINSHQSYHIGQIGILRRYLGKEAMGYFK